MLSGTVLGHYKLIRQLGQGGMGVVWEAVDQKLGRSVAVKLLTEATRDSKAALERFWREARAASSLNHPGICTIYELNESAETPFIVMELLDGKSLETLYRGQPMPYAKLLEMGVQLADALDAAHRKGILHRDIKPANIIVTSSGQAKLLDFGLAKLEDAAESDPDAQTGVNPLTSLGSSVGTVAYMSPEQARAEPLDARSDLFSLGVVLYEMATGVHPFSGSTTAVVFGRILHEAPVAPISLNAQLPVEFEQVLNKTLEKDRELRCQNAAELRGDLKRLQRSSSSGSEVSSATRASGSSSRVRMAPVEASRERSRWTVFAVAGVVVLAVLAAGGFFLWRSHNAGASPHAGATVMHERDSVILSDFTNQTGDPVFDTTLTQALEIQLEQSPFLTVVGQQHLRQSLQYLGKPSSEKITPEIAREIGIREGIKAIINGTISRLGDQYIVTLEAQSTASGDSIANEQAKAADKNHVLDALDQATTAMRGKLGESLSSIQKLDTPLGQATTPSLEAFRSYALGDVEHEQEKDIPEAEGHYKRALELDPKFAMAWARLGVVYGNSGANGKALEYYQKAYDLSANVSEREKLYIAGHYYDQVTGDVIKEIETLELATRTYPQSDIYWNNLGEAYSYLGDYRKGIVATQHALDVQPDDGIARQNQIINYTAVNEFATARDLAEHDLKLGIGETSQYRNALVPLYFLLGNQARMQEQIDWAVGKPEEYLVLEAAAVVREFEGRYRDADALYQKAFDQVQQQKLPDVAAGMLLLKAQGKAIAGMCSEAPALVKQALSLDKSKGTVRSAGLPAALCGEAKLVTPLLEELAKKNPQDTLINTLYLPQTRAADDLVNHRPDQALRDLDAMGSYNFISQQEYLRGRAYLDLHNGTAAAEAFRKVIAAKGATLSGGQLPALQDYALAQLGLARALAMQGDKAGAKKAYQDFFETWKNADPELPQLLAARTESAKLN